MFLGSKDQSISTHVPLSKCLNALIFPHIGTPKSAPIPLLDGGLHANLLLHGPESTAPLRSYFKFLGARLRIPPGIWLPRSRSRLRITVEIAILLCRAFGRTAILSLAPLTSGQSMFIPRPSITQHLLLPTNICHPATGLSERLFYEQNDPDYKGASRNNRMGYVFVTSVHSRFLGGYTASYSLSQHVTSLVSPVCCRLLRPLTASLILIMASGVFLETKDSQASIRLSTLSLLRQDRLILVKYDGLMFRLF